MIFTRQLLGLKIIGFKVYKISRVPVMLFELVDFIEIDRNIIGLVCSENFIF